MRVISTSVLVLALCLAGCGGSGNPGGPGGNPGGGGGGGGTGGNGGGGGMGPPTPPPVVPPGPPPANQDYCGAALPGLLDCRNGSEAAWQTSLGPIANYNACVGSLAFNLAGVVIDSGATGGAVSALAGAQGDRLDCGPGCALPAEKVLVLSDTTPPMVTIFAGHDQTRFAWSDALQSWQAEPYVYKSLIAATSQGANPQALTGNFAAADVWVVYDRELGYEAYQRYGSEKVWRISERNDALASQQKRTAFAAGQTPATLGSEGRTTAYVRDANGYLLEMRDYRYPAVTALVVGRDAASGNRVDKLTFVRDNATMDAATTVQLSYVDASPGAPLSTLTANGEAPYQLTFANNQLTQIIDPTGDKLHYSYRSDGRLGRLWHDALDAHAAAPEGTSVDFGYGDCTDGSPLPDTAGARAFACKVTMTDQDGFAYWTQFTPFDAGGATPNPPERSYVSAEGRSPGGSYYNESFVRSTAGYLVKKSASAAATTQWTPGCGDGKPAGKWTVERTDGGGTTATSTVDTSRVSYVARRFDGDNQVVREISNSGETDTTYQKSGSPPAELQWANLLPATVATKSFDAGGNLVTVKQTLSIAAGGQHGGSFTVTLNEPYSGGSTIVELDDRLRAVAHQSPGDVGSEFATIGYDAYGFVATEKATGGAMLSTLSHFPSGNTKSLALQVCGKARESIAFTENQYKGIASRTTTLGGTTTLSVTAADYLPSGSPKTVTVATPNYTRTETRAYSAAGAVLEGLTENTSVDGTSDVETMTWHTKGY